MEKDRPSRKETWNIGIVKFFDSKKGFGFIASNNCHIPRPEYVQDFHVRDSSFSDTCAKSDRTLVVFEGINAAKQVRRYNKNSETDRQLGVSYYFDHEIMHLKGVSVNIFHDLSVPRSEWLPEVISRVKNQVDRTLESTLNLIKHFVGKYKKELPGGYRYIFTKDFDSELHGLWQELFNSLSADESLAVLSSYPPAAIYFDEEIVGEWIDSLGDNITQDLWPDLQYCADKLAEPLQSVLKAKIKKSADIIASHIIANWSENKSLDAYVPIYDSLHGDLKSIVSKYNIYTDTDFSTQIEEANNQRKLLCFQSLLSEFEEQPRSNWDKALNLFNELNNNPQAKSLLFSSAQKAFEKLKSQNNIRTSVEFLNRVKNIFPEFFITSSVELWDTIADYLTKQLKDAIQAKSQYKFEKEFENDCNVLLSIYNEDRIISFRPKITKTIIDSDAIDIINYAAESDYKWISRDTAISKSREFLDSMKNENLQELVGNSSSYLLSEVKELIVIRLLALYSGKSLEDYLDGSSHEFVEPIRYNIQLLKSLKDFIIFDSPTVEQSWAFYVNSLSAKDTLQLYHNDVIERLPNNIIESLIEDLNIGDTYQSSERWYDKPAFKNQSLNKIFSDPNIDIIPPITKFLKRTTFNRENAYKFVWLIELLSSNRPENMDYWESRRWETNFKLKLQQVRSEITDPKPAVVLWSVYFQTGAPRASLTEIYSCLPPYLQIRILKRLMMGIDEGKLKHTAQSLYDFLGGGKDPLCLPVEIVFSYLILRENDPNTWFSNKHMLSLLDSREDHSEWIGIRKFVDECHGRVQTEWPEYSSSFRTPYYNGLMKVENAGIKLIIPSKMVDDQGHLQQYNNKYFNRISDVISLNFSPSKARQEAITTGTVYYFEKSEIKSVIGLCREFKIYWKNSHIKFIINENSDDYFCECRLANDLSRGEALPFYWCDNKPCFRNIIRFHTPEEWEQYTLLDFMRIFRIPVDYTNRVNGFTKFGYYIFFNTYLKGFAKFYEHLKCRECGELLHPKDLSNFATMSVTEFSCQNPNCSEKDNIVYLNHCFNRPKCTAIIDSRDSKKCPNGRYICPECGGCCSTKNEQNRLSNLQMTGGYIPQHLSVFIERRLGHWEKDERYCYKCGKIMSQTSDGFICDECDVKYNYSSRNDK